MARPPGEGGEAHGTFPRVPRRRWAAVGGGQVRMGPGRWFPEPRPRRTPEPAPARLPRWSGSPPRNTPARVTRSARRPGGPPAAAPDSCVGPDGGAPPRPRRVGEGGREREEGGRQRGGRGRPGRSRPARATRADNRASQRSALRGTKASERLRLPQPRRGTRRARLPSD